MTLSWTAIADSLVDPIDGDPLVLSDDGTVLRSTRRTYPIVADQPILLADEPMSVLGWHIPAVALTEHQRPRPAERPISMAKRWRRRLRLSVEQLPGRTLFCEVVTARTGRHAKRVLIVGGASLGEGTDAFGDSVDVEVVAFDIYPTAATTFVADAHRIPLADGTVDAVWIQAVLEHVYDPVRVVGEIARVLRSDGVVYAETPFLQPVHEGAYDYVRFSPAGHRMLFAAFDEIAAGPIGGPAGALVLALRALVAGLTRSPMAGKIAYAAALPLAALDRAVPDRFRTDSCTGAYFLGRLRSDRSTPTYEPLEEYRGAQ